MQICGRDGVIALTAGCASSALPIVLESYRIKSLLDCTSSRKRVSSKLKSITDAIQESL
jgi:hypothetical protein